MTSISIGRRSGFWCRAGCGLGLTLALAFTPGVLSSALAHQGVHRHGQLDLDVAVDATTLTVRFESPLDNFLGFERAPRSDDERRRVADLATRLKAADQLLRPDPAARCRLTRVDIESAVPGLGDPGGDDHDEADHADHADIDVTAVFTCPQAAQARFLDVALFPAYPRLQRIEVRIASPRGQFRRSLVPGAARIDWGRTD